MAAAKSTRRSFLLPDAGPTRPGRPAARLLVLVFLVTVSLFAWLGTSRAQDPGHRFAPVQLSFLPPPLEHATYSLGVFNTQTNQLVRHLQEFAPEKEFTVGLNGLATTWDGKDDDGKSLPPGRYAARGYAVGPLKVEGEDITGNDWVVDDENFRVKRINALTLLPVDGGVAVLALLADGSSSVARYSIEGKRLWSKPVPDLPADGRPWLQATDAAVAVMPTRPVPDGTPVRAAAVFRVADGAPLDLSYAVTERNVPLPPLPPGAVPVSPPPAAQFSPALTAPDLSIRSGVGAHAPDPVRGHAPRVADTRTQRSPGKDGTVWTAAGLLGLVQNGPDGTSLRRLEVVPGDPVPVAVSAASGEDRLYLLEEKPGWQRVRGLSWVETAEEDGQPVSTWKTFFERSIHQPEASSMGTKDGPIEVNLDENPLSPGAPPKIRLVGTFDAKGSYLAAENGLRLRRISERADLQGVHLGKGKPPTPLSFFQYDGAATDEFSVSGVHRIMAFDAGEFELTASGEKPADSKAAEPPGL